MSWVQRMSQSIQLKNYWLFNKILFKKNSNSSILLNNFFNKFFFNVFFRPLEFERLAGYYNFNPKNGILQIANRNQGYQGLINDNLTPTQTQTQSNSSGGQTQPNYGGSTTTTAQQNNQYYYNTNNPFIGYLPVDVVDNNLIDGVGGSVPVGNNNNIMDGLRVQIQRSRKTGASLRSPNVRRSNESQVTLRGWLYRLEGAALKQWKRRWFVLADFCLFYYKGKIAIAFWF